MRAASAHAPDNRDEATNCTITVMSDLGFNRRACVALSGLVLSAAPALGLDADDLLNFSWGRLSLKPQLDLTEMYTDNLAFGNNDATLSQIYRPLLGFNPAGTPILGPATTNNVVVRPKESDLVTTISPGARLDFGAGGGNLLSLELVHDQITNLEHSDADTSQEHILFRAELERSRFKLSGRSQLAYLSSFLGGAQFVGETTGTLIKRRLWSDDYKLTYDSSGKTDIYISASNYETDYDKGTRLFDYNTWKASLGTSYKMTAKVALFSEGHYGQTAVNPNTTAQAKGPHSTFYGGYVGFRGEFTAKITGTVKVGYETREFPGTGTATGAGTPAVEATVSYIPRPKTQLLLNYSRRTDVSSQLGSQVLTYDSLGITVAQALGNRGKWSIQGNTSLNNAVYGDIPTTVPVLARDASGQVIFDRVGNATYRGVPGNVGRSDRTLSTGVGIIYQPFLWLSGTLTYQYENYSLDFKDAAYASLHPLIPYDNHMVALRVAIGF